MFWDDLRVSKEYGKDFEKLNSLSSNLVQCFEITNIHEWRKENIVNKKPFPSPEFSSDKSSGMFPPPSQFFFLEFKVKYSCEGTKGVIAQQGIFVACLPCGSLTDKVFEKAIEMQKNYNGKEDIIRETKPDDQDHLVKAIYNDAKEIEGKSFREIVSEGKYCFILDMYARIYNLPIRKFPLRTFSDRRLVSQTIMFGDEEGLDNDQKKLIVENASCDIPTTIDLVYLFLLFLSTKNVTVQILRDSNEKQNKARARKGKLPLSIYKVLTIDPNKIHKEYLPASGSGGTGISPRFHFCRGHFKQFSEEKPLLGKYAGTWFWTLQMRGKKSQGEVRKDYKVLPATTEEAK
jgi:hypothetical protein